MGDVLTTLKTALSKAQGTIEDIHNLQSAVERALESNFFEIVPDEKSQGPKKIISLVIQRKGDTALIEGEMIALGTLCKTIAAALWGALDDVVQAIASSGDEHAIFPGSANPRKPEPLRFEREIARFPNSVRPIIRKLDPRNSRNGEPLWIIRRIADFNTNQTVVEAPFPTVRSKESLSATKGVELIDRWDPVQKRLVFFRTTGNPEENYNLKDIPIQIVFRGPQIRHPKPVIETFEKARLMIISLFDELGRLT